MDGHVLVSTKFHRLILFDNDGTLNTQFSCWRYTQQPLGIFEPHGRKLLENHLRGEMDYEEFSNRTVKLWKGLKLSEFERIISEYPLRDGTIETLSYFREHGYRVSCVSSGVDLWKPVFEKRHDFVFDDYLANHLVTEDGILTGEIEVNVTDDTPSKNKGEHLKNLCGKYGFEMSETIMVGDGIGDINAFRIADISFAIDPTHDEVADAANHVIRNLPLSEMLKYFDNGIYRQEGS